VSGRSKSNRPRPAWEGGIRWIGLIQEHLPELYRPGLPPVPHLPEHPLISAGHDEVPSHRVERGRRKPARRLVRDVQYCADKTPELLRSVRPDPAGVERVRRAGPFEFFADLPIDPVA